MKSALVYTAEGVVSTKAQRQRDFMTRNAQAHAPPSYTHNSIKEELCLEYIQSFAEQFSRAYKNRATPFLVAENEFGVRKCVCTTLRPTLIAIPELYDVYECASFLAGYALYEPLENPQEPPKSLFSPQQVLESHTGDSFDLATLLCSFLLGAGYDAYVVYGVAPQFITRKDQSLTKCPLIADAGESARGSKPSHTSHTHAHAFSAADEDGEDSQSVGASTEEDLSPSHYVAPDTTVRESAFLSSLAEKQRLRSIDTFSLWIPDPPLESITNANATNSIADGGVHAWVLLRAGRREIKEDTFVEPSTGRLYSVKNSPYLAVDAVWNHVSYFVNAKREIKVSEIQFHFEEGWEPLFLSRAASKTTETNNDSGEDHDLMHNDGAASGEQKTSSSFGGGGGDDETLRYFDAPPAWSAPLSLPRHKYLVRYPPHGLRTVQYYCAKADFFAKGTNDQCMVMRITLYLNQACTIVKEIHEWFENRIDRMYKRIRYFLDDRRFVEFFNPGSRGEIKRWTERPGRSIEVDFFVDGRLDRLARREEIIGQSVTETFRGRTDLLVFRSVTLTADKGDALSGTRQFTLPATHLGPELFITRMVQEFERNPVPSSSTSASSSSAPSLSSSMSMSAANKAGSGSKSRGEGEGDEEEMEIAKRDFFVREGKVVLYYHFAPNQVTGRVRTLMHTKGPTVPVPTDLAISQEVGLEEDPDACQEAAALERECFTAVKTSYQAHDKLTEARLAGEMRVHGEKTVFERALDSVEFLTAKTTSALDSSSATESKGIDFLAPFLRNVADPNQLTREEALAIRQACLDALKARLVERANIIQTKLHEENAKLGRKQELFQRSQREGDFSTEEYEKYCTEAMFRIQILEQRLAAHEEAALRKFSDLDLKLSNDPRLRVLKS